MGSILFGFVEFHPELSHNLEANIVVYAEVVAHLDTLDFPGVYFYHFIVLIVFTWLKFVEDILRPDAMRECIDCRHEGMVAFTDQLVDRTIHKRRQAHRRIDDILLLCYHCHDWL